MAVPDVLATKTPSNLFVLVHSPLVGPLTWSLAARALRRQGHDSLVPVVRDRESSMHPYWEQEVASVAQALVDAPAERGLVLVGHSGAGALLPAIGLRTEHATAAYLFVDAVLPLDGASQLDEMRATAPALARELRTHLAAGGRFPEWREEDLVDAIPNARLRRRLVAELQPRPLAFFDEPIPGFAEGPDGPCAYLQFGAAYDVAGARAQREGWAYRRIKGEHFHMLVDPVGVAGALVDLLASSSHGSR
jgi:hypothetical protein